MITVWDRDMSRDEFMGYAALVLKPEHLEPSGPKPTWIPLSYHRGDGQAGCILTSLSANQGSMPSNMAPSSKKYYFKMKILGLRNLKSLGILPVKKAFVRFYVDSVRIPQDKALLPEKRFLKTQPLDSGPNPNILSVVK